MLVESYNHHIPNIDALNSDTQTLRIQYEYTQKQCVGVAIEGKDIWYMVINNMSYFGLTGSLALIGKEFQQKKRISTIWEESLKFTKLVTNNLLKLTSI